MNQIFLIGRLVEDPELKFTQAGKAVANFRLAVNRRFDRDQADFFRVTVWGKQAEAAAQYLVKGSQCAIRGRVEINQYQDKDGNNRYSTDIIAEEVEFLSKKSDNSNVSTTYGSNPTDDDLDSVFPVVDDEDIPF